MYLVMDKVLFKIFKTMSTDSLLWRNFSARVKLIRVREEKFNSDAACIRVHQKNKSCVIELSRLPICFTGRYITAVKII